MNGENFFNNILNFRNIKERLKNLIIFVCLKEKDDKLGIRFVIYIIDIGFSI